MSRISRILVAMDFSDCSQAAFRWAASLASSLGSDLAVVIVASDEPADGQNTVYADRAQVEGSLKNMLAERLADLPEAAAYAAEYPPRLLVRNGRAVEEILDAADEEDADLVVVGTHGRQGVARTLIGSVAEAVVRRAPCPVVIVHAESGRDGEAPASKPRHGVCFTGASAMNTVIVKDPVLAGKVDRRQIKEKTMKCRGLIAKDIMTKHLVKVRDDMSLQGLAALFSQEMITGAPVTDESGRLVGVVSYTDIVRHLEQRDRLSKDRSNPALHGWEGKLDPEDFAGLHVEEDDGFTVRDVMTPTVFDVDEDMPIAEVADRMLRGRIHRLLVTRDGEAVGIITTMDMLKAIAA